MIGHPQPLCDARDKASGRTRFVTDLALDGMVHGAVVRCPHAHAELESLDVAAAAAMPGVVAVVTAADGPQRPVPGEPFYGEHLMTRPLFPSEARYVGSPIAAVAAETPELARAAAARIAVEWRALPAVLKVEDGADALPFGRVLFERGDPDAAFAAAEHVFEDAFSTSTVQAAAFEPYACLVEPHEDGGLTLWKGVAAPFEARRALATWLDLSEGQVRVRIPPVGGGFGSRTDDLEFIAALLALKARRPVRLVLERTEGFLAGRVRHGARLRIRSGLDRSGRLVARELEAVYDTGAYLDLGPYVILRALRPLALYPAPAMRFVGRLVTTHRPISGATRGFGNPQATFAVESHTDRLCRELGLDPVDFRKAHAVRTGDANLSVGVVDTSTGRFHAKAATISSCALPACLDLVQAALTAPGTPPPGKKRGVGLAAAMHTTGKGRQESSHARVHLRADGTAEVHSGAPDQGGTGVATTLGIIAADALGLPFEAVTVAPPDTAEELTDSGAQASGRTYVAGEAVRRAAALAAERRDAGEALPLSADGLFEPTSNAPPFAATGAIVDVDAETGAVTVVRIVVAADVGRVLNPLHCRGQLTGAVAQGLGFALTERLDFDDAGRLVTRGLLDYGLLRSADMPEIEVHFVDSHEPTHPLGVKGAGEIGLMGVAPAVANAIADATGTRMRRLPMDPPTVWETLTDANRHSCD